jgi:drug/metabolite transporter (DMT)-like permease
VTAVTDRRHRTATAPWRVHGALVLVQVMFGTLPVAGKLVFEHLAPMAVALLRTALAAVLFALIHRAVAGRVRVREDLFRLAVYALFGVALNQILFLGGLERTTATRASVLVATIPVWTVLIALLLGRERFRWSRVLGIATATFGVAWLSTGGFTADVGEGSVLGDVMVTANAISFAVYLVISREILARHGSLTVITWVFAFGALWTLPVGAPALVATPLSVVPFAAWAGVAWILLVPTVGSYMLNTWALARAESSQVAAYILLQPVVAATLAVLILAERPGPGTLLGSAIVVVGVLVTTLSGRAATRLAPETPAP